MPAAPDSLFYMPFLRSQRVSGVFILDAITRVIISPRESTVATADRIIVLNDSNVPAGINSFKQAAQREVHAHGQQGIWRIPLWLQQ